MGTHLVKSIRKNEFLLIIQLTIALGLIQVATLTGNQILTYLGSMWLIWNFIFASKIVTLSIIMFLLPSNEYIMFAGTSLITILITIYFFKSVFLLKERIYIHLIVLTIILIIYTLPFQIEELTSTVIKTFLYLYSCISIFTENDRCDENYKINIEVKDKYVKSIEYLGLGIIIASIYTIVLNPQMINTRFSLVSTEQSTNILGIFTVFTIANLLMMIQNNNFRVKKSWIYSIFPLMMIGFLTQSRTFVFLMGFIVIWLILFAFIKSNSKSKYKLAGFIFVAIITAFFILGKNDLFMRIFNNAVERIINPNDNDISGGRTELYWIYINELIENKSILFFGSGRLFSPNTNMLAHNIILEQLYYLGIVGNSIIVMMFSLTMRIIRIKNNLKFRSLYGFLPILIFIAAAMASHTFIGRPDTIRFILAFVAIGLFTQCNKKEHNNFYISRKI